MIKVAGYRDPAIGVQILDASGDILVEQTLGQFIHTNRNTPEWVEIGSVIYSGTNTALTVVFVSQGPALNGNDYAIDDIALYEVNMPDLIPVKTSNTSNAVVGESVKYTVELSNIYDRTITNVIFQDTVPEGLTFIPGTVTVDGVSQPTVDPNMGFTLPDVPEGKTITVTFSAVVVYFPSVNPTLNTAKTTYDYTIVEGGISTPHETESNDASLYIEKPKPSPKKRCSCYTPVTKCRRNICGQKTWVDNNNINGTRPDTIEIILLRNGEIYKRTIVDSAGDGAFAFCCVPIGQRPGHRYNYQIDEVVPDGYTKIIEGYNVTNTLVP